MNRPLARAWPAIGLLLAANVLNFIDRHLPFILIGDIKAELRLSDAQIAMMTGVSFALVYSLAALRLGRLADRMQPRLVMGASLAVWSAMTAVSGLATNFAQLILCRAGVAASEAGSTPAAHALIARVVERRGQALALAVFSLGVPIGSMLGLALGGWLSEAAGWRGAFLAVGLPGLMLALACCLALPKLTEDAEAPQAMPFGAVLRALWSFRAFRYMTAANTFYAASSYAINTFAPAFLMRSHDMGTARAGLLMGLVYGLGGIAGTLGGGWLADRLAQREEAWRLRLPALGQMLSLPVTLAAWLVSDTSLAIVLLTLGYMFALLSFAPSFSAAQALVSNEMRGTTSAVMLFFMTLIGASLGPLAVGWISDGLTSRFGADALGYALCVTTVSTALAMILFHAASRHLPGELQPSTKPPSTDMVMPST